MPGVVEGLPYEDRQSIVLVSILLRVYLGQEASKPRITIMLGKMVSKEIGMHMHQVCCEHREEIPNPAGRDGEREAGKETGKRVCCQVREKNLHSIRAKITKRILKPSPISNSF